MHISLLIKKIKNRLYRIFDQGLKRIQARSIGITFIEPNYLFLGTFDDSSVIIDVGCGYDADFSLEMVRRYGLKSFGVDPTKKHQDGLQRLSQKTQGHFVPIPLAVSATNGELTFYESTENVSGSLHTNHVNVKNDHISSYVVESVTLHTLMERLGLTRANYIKLDLEGAEYELIQKSDAHAFDYFKQVLVEFHHHCVDSYSLNDTKNAVIRMRERGFRAFSFDDQNYLFYRI